MGHTFGVRIDGAAPRGLWPPAGGGLCKRVAEKGFLRWTGPMGRRVRKFDGAFGPRVVDCPTVHSEHILKER